MIVEILMGPNRTKMPKLHKQIPLTDYSTYSPEEMKGRADAFYRFIKSRRTVRDFSSKSVPLEVVKSCIDAAATAPSGANRQPWHFVVVSDPEIKTKIRTAAEKEEHHFYHGGVPDEWRDAVQPLGTDESKPFLETAPHLIVIFAERVSVNSQDKLKNYYVSESVGIATGILITALHACGLGTLTHTPSPMRFLNEILNQPDHRRPYLILVTGYPSQDATVPDITRKKQSEFATFL